VTNANRFRWTSASRSDVGMVREINEDAYLDRPKRGLWAVADGMGGHTLGDLASRMVVEALDQLRPDNDLLKFLDDARGRLQEVNRHLRREAVIRDARIIGSTVVVLLASDGYCGYLWAGDSRIYLLREGRLRQLTRDHSKVEELKSRGELTSENAVNHPARNTITRAIGAADTLDLDGETLQAGDGDMFLLCSDGLSNTVSEQEMRSALVPGDCRQASEALVEMALKRGGRDNISAVVVRAEDLYSNDKTVLNPAV
jgi:protein phosphatase